ncbi:MAG TPA: ACP S-malonyltransferase [Ruminiclostridium sp.]|nr:ACP S-malonyltransferase [Ruminiclostridium sp.]
MSKIALLFPGQGSQYVGMGKPFFDNFTIAKDTFHEAGDVLGFDLSKICFEGGMEELTRTEHTQPAILTTSVAMFRVFMQELGIKPHCLAGHSLGEISALTCTGAVKFSDAVILVRNRGLYMQNAVPNGLGAMSSISKIDRACIEEECRLISQKGKTVVVSNYNSKEQIVVSGDKEAVSELGEVLIGKGAEIVPLKVSAPFHSPLMQPAASAFKEEIGRYEFNDMKWSVISNVDALPYGSRDEIKDKLVTQIVSPVLWDKSMKYMFDMGMEYFIEIGPKTVLKNLTLRNLSGVKAYAYDKKEDSEKLAGDLRRMESETVQNTSFNAVIDKCVATAVCTRNRNWDESQYQSGVVKPYNDMTAMQESLETEGGQATIEQAHKALSLLKIIFETKKVPLEEQIERFNQVIRETETISVFDEFLKILE